MANGSRHSPLPFWVKLIYGSGDWGISSIGMMRSIFPWASNTICVSTDSKSMAPRSRTLPAHNGQVRELAAFLEGNRTPGAPLLLGGDFNIRNSPARYYYGALDRPYTVVGEFCSRVSSGCGEVATDVGSEPWLRTQDLQAFGQGAVRVEPIRSQAIFTASRTRRALSDHDGYLVRYRLSWSAATLATWRPDPSIEMKPHKLGVRISWRP